MSESTPVKAVRADAGRMAGAAGKAAPIADVLATVCEVVGYMKEAQIQDTERERIRAERDCVVAQIQAEKEVILAYFEHRFAERKVVLERFFTVLDQGVAHKNDKLLDTALQGIVNVVKDNPLSDFETFRRKMKRDDFQLDV